MPSTVSQPYGHAPRSDEVAALDARFGLPGALAFADSALGGVVAEMHAAERGSRATVALKGAQVLSFSTPDLGDVLWLSPLARLDTAKAVRGGIPVCWPWFGAHAAQPTRPAHGFARMARWTVLDTAAREATSVLRLSLDGSDGPDGAAAGYENLGATLEIVLGADLTITLTTHNRGRDAVAVTSALHTYFSVGDIGLTSVDGLGERPFIDQLDGGQRKREAGLVRFDGELDRIYQDTPDAVSIVDAARVRRIGIAKRGSQSTVVWNPGPAKAERLGDLGPDGYRRMVCVETANAGADVVVLPPGAEHALTAIISATRL